MLGTGAFNLLGAVASIVQNWDAAEKGWGHIAVATAIVAATVILTATWLRFSRSQPTASRWARNTIIAVAVSAVVALGVSTIVTPTPHDPPPPPPTTVPLPPSTTAATTTTATTVTSAAVTTTATSVVPTTSRRRPTEPLPPPPPPPPPEPVSWQSPLPSETVRSGVDPVSVRGHVTGLPAGHEIWVLSRPPDPTSSYFVVQGGPLDKGNGDFSGTDSSAGDPKDPHGTEYQYVAVDADPACSTQLHGFVTHAKDRSYRVTAALVGGCRWLEPRTAVHSR